MKAERQVMTEAEAGRMRFEDRRRGHREGMQEAETDKETDSLRNFKGTNSANTLTTAQ